MTLTAEGLTIRLAGRPVVIDVTTRFPKGKLTAIMGPNGAGKTTLVRALAVDLAASQGNVNWEHEPIGSWSPTDLALLRSFLSQDTPADIPFTVREVGAMGRAPYRQTEDSDLAEDRRLVDEAMETMDITALADRRFGHISGGERARASLARVLAQQAHVILLDEPTTSLDLGHQENVLSCFGQEAESGRTVVAVLHDLNLAACHADRIVFLDGGRITAEGPPVEVLETRFLTSLYRHPVEVVDHPFRETPLVVTRQP